MTSLIQLVRDKHTKLAEQRLENEEMVYSQYFKGSICPPSVTPFDPHSGVDSVLLTNMALLLDIIYIELRKTNPTLQMTSRLEVMKQLESSNRAYENCIFEALSDELSFCKRETELFSDEKAEE